MNNHSKQCCEFCKAKIAINSVVNGFTRVDINSCKRNSCPCHLQPKEEKANPFNLGTPNIPGYKTTSANSTPPVEEKKCSVKDRILTCYCGTEKCKFPQPQPPQEWSKEFEKFSGLFVRNSGYREVQAFITSTLQANQSKLLGGIREKVDNLSPGNQVFGLPFPSGYYSCKHTVLALLDELKSTK